MFFLQKAIRACTVTIWWRMQNLKQEEFQNLIQFLNDSVEQQKNTKGDMWLEVLLYCHTDKISSFL